MDKVDTCSAGGRDRGEGTGFMRQTMSPGRLFLRLEPVLTVVLWLSANANSLSLNGDRCAEFLHRKLRKSFGEVSGGVGSCV